MGFNTGRFLQPPDPNLLCSVCSGVLDQAVLTPCGHSFCSLCLHTWLHTCPTCPTCPECRAQVTPTLVKPIHALRNLVRGLQVWCDHHDQGCKEVVALDQLSHHLTTCPYHPVPCAGCGKEVRRLELAEHHMKCAAIAATVEDKDDDNVAGLGENSTGAGGEESEGSWLELRQKIHGTKPLTTSDVSLMLNRIRALETRADHLFQELKCARSRTLALERELGNLSMGHFLHHHKPRITPRNFLPLSSTCVRILPETIGELSRLIARHLLKKPREVEAEGVFRAIGRCYDTFFHRGGPNGRHDVHMLLATAYASNWFSAGQRLCLQCWLKTLTKTSSSSSSCTRPTARLFNNV